MEEYSMGHGRVVVSARAPYRMHPVRIVRTRWGLEPLSTGGNLPGMLLLAIDGNMHALANEINLGHNNRVQNLDQDIRPRRRKAEQEHTQKSKYSN